MEIKTFFEASVLLPASPSEVFNFHQNPNNISAIAPQSLKVLSVKAEPHATVGQTFFLRVRQFGVTAEWLGVWETVESPGQLVDEGVKCPFRYWRHEHIFREVEAGTRMVDRVTLIPKGGKLVAILARPMLLLFLKKMFHDRHQATRGLFQNGGQHLP
ncbi:MAG: SRPBCC family protein [Terrimicrobiaceae bacterium]